MKVELTEMEAAFLNYLLDNLSRLNVLDPEA